MNARIVSCVVAVLTLAGVPAAAQSAVGHVLDVPKGDVLVVEYRGAERQVRLFGVDAPELGQPFGSEARAWTASKVLGKDVLLSFRDGPEPGAPEDADRLLAVAALPSGESSLNEALVAEGYAWAYDRHALNARLKRVQVEAMQTRKGLWQDAAPLAPWDYREKDRAEAVVEDSGDESRYGSLRGQEVSGPNRHVRVTDDDVLEIRLRGEAPPSTTVAPPQRRAAPQEAGRTSVLQDGYQPRALRQRRSGRSGDNVIILRTDPNRREE